ncbi:hypothetical protein N0V88_007496 [Collariella sp. IMI 366227]|nr:hypothetical protein N0V88_007496 [Collariella sp. IMI 366227]
MSFKFEAPKIKTEPGVFIKSEFGPSLASLPLAPSVAPKKEFGDNKKPRIFEKLHQAHFYIEPTERPGPFLADFCANSSPGGILRFAIEVCRIEVRRVEAQPAAQALVKKETKDSKSFFSFVLNDGKGLSLLGLSSSSAPARTSKRLYRPAFLPVNLPTINTWQVQFNGDVTNFYSGDKHGPI